MGNSCTRNESQNEGGSRLEATASNCHTFLAERVTEESIVRLEIKNFIQLQEMNCFKKQKTGIEFCAGESLDQKSTWRLELQFTTVNQMGLYLYLKEPGKNICAKYDASIVHPNSGQVFLSHSTLVREYSMTSMPGWGFPKFVTLDQLKTAGALVNDNALHIVVQIKMVIYGEQMTHNTTPTNSTNMFKQNGFDEMGKHFGVILQTGECSDFVIRVKKLDSQDYEERKVHRIILSARSPVFLAMLSSPMSEKETGIMTIEDMTPKGLDVLLKFIYTGNLPHDWKHVPQEILNAAEKYNLPLLKKHCDKWLHTACTNDNVLSLLDLAKAYGLSKASKNILKYIKSNLGNVLDKV